jgi:DNA transformation protein and related proteins
MTSRQSTADFLVDQLSGAGQVSARKMFGEYCVYLAGKPVALLCDDQLFLKPTEAGRRMLGPVTEAPPYPGARQHFLISADRWEDGEWLCRLVTVTADELAASEPRKRKR